VHTYKNLGAKTYIHQLKSPSRSLSQVGQYLKNAHALLSMAERSIYTHHRKILAGHIHCGHTIHDGTYKALWNVDIINSPYCPHREKEDWRG